MPLTLDSKIEALLFFKAEPISVKKMSQILSVSEEEVGQSITILEEKLSNRGVSLLYKDGEVMLSTAVEASSMIEELIKEELSKDLGKAGLETLSIILYRGPVARSKVDYIRGVSSAFILRNLLVRGLVERIVNTSDQRSFLYRPTFELLSYLGVTKIEDLPEYEKVEEELKTFETQKNEDEDPKQIEQKEDESVDLPINKDTE